ncbi:hypothetical protein Ade02nite_28310 [Paractinoplanes deccanensis]|uniref:Uncharacterized protein n=1 Tax=Paractinoplanes deccanensis TaxID=113561 RepID=A0ABQ3Y2U7_9ACTN|nr:hypothetical protein [Actinoplanes deccanensis]GID74190.1 hypothetical protein Ade02nite_28310 [Actinoplanes deccanensis]
MSNPERSWELHCRLAGGLTSEAWSEWRPAVLRKIERLREGLRGQPHLRNLKRWQRLVDEDDLAGLLRVMTGRDTDFVEMREVSPLRGLPLRRAGEDRCGSSPG